MLDNVGGRKVVITLIMIIVGIVTVALKGDITTNFSAFLQFLVTAFIAGNSLEHVTDVMQSHADSKAVAAPPAPQLDMSPLTNSIDELKAADNEIAKSVSIVQQSLSLIIQKYGIDKLP